MCVYIYIYIYSNSITYWMCATIDNVGYELEYMLHNANTNSNTIACCTACTFIGQDRAGQGNIRIG